MEIQNKELTERIIAGGNSRSQRTGFLEQMYEEGLLKDES